MYPLKFLFAMLMKEFFEGGAVVHLADGRIEPMLAGAGEARVMMRIYGLGFGAIFIVFSLLYAHALKKKDDLGLSDVEIFDAKASLRGYLLMVGVAALSILVLEVTGAAGLAGLVYILTGVSQAIYWRVSFARRKRLLPHAPQP